MECSKKAAICKALAVTMILQLWLIATPPAHAQILTYPEGCVPSWMPCVDNVGWPFTEQNNCCEQANAGDGESVTRTVPNGVVRIHSRAPGIVRASTVGGLGGTCRSGICATSAGATGPDRH
uniref:Uncharacterized protein n=1 Tax=Oryza brachyantha TaxID=4533 RepID=J3MF73_ORYBR